MRLVAPRAAAELRNSGRPAAVLPALVLLRIPQDSAGLTAAERERNLDGALAAASDTRRLSAGAHVVLVDDVVTTGTTLREGARALREQAVQLSAAAVAGTVRRWAAPLSVCTLWY